LLAGFFFFKSRTPPNRKIKPSAPLQNTLTGQQARVAALAGEAPFALELLKAGDLA